MNDDIAYDFKDERVEDIEEFYEMAIEDGFYNAARQAGHELFKRLYGEFRNLSDVSRKTSGNPRIIGSMSEIKYLMKCVASKDRLLTVAHFALNNEKGGLNR